MSYTNRKPCLSIRKTCGAIPNMPIKGLRLVRRRGIFLLRVCDWFGPYCHIRAIPTSPPQTL
eukprot:413587-Pyramimonas_sp.AAC.1